MTNYTGSCLCGGVTYTVNGELRPIVYCHCEQCRKTSGNFVAATACAAEDLELRSDATLCWFAASSIAERGFCNQCGGNLFWRPLDGSHISIFAGSLPADTALSASAHIYVENKAHYVEIGDGLPQHQQRGPFDVTRFNK